MNKRIIKFEEYKGLVNDICRKISLGKWRPDYVVGITRGGLLPAVMISQYFDIPCETLKIQLRDGGESESNLWMSEDAFGYPIYDPMSGSDGKKRILVVDDINDQGSTLNWLINDWQDNCLPDDPSWKDVWNQNVKFAVVIDNVASQCCVAMDFCGEEINKAEQDVWIEFPYESWWR